MSEEQGADMDAVWGNLAGSGFLDLVTGWYRLAAEFIQNTPIRVAFVSTNSICQGEQSAVLWTELFQKWKLKIHFAHRTFTWESEARGKAHVHVVIVGFGAFDISEKRLYDYSESKSGVVAKVTNISPYLVEGSDVVLPIRKNPICDVPAIVNGNKPADGGFLIIEQEEKREFLEQNPTITPFLKPMLSADQYLNGKERWVLWLVDAPPHVISENPGVMARIANVREFRAKSPKGSTRRMANQPSLFDQIRQPKKPYIVIPRHSSEARQYVPFGYFGPETIISDSCTAVPEATLYHFGTLTSAMHMAWLKQVCGRLKSDFRYSNKLVYNNFPWPTPTDTQREAVEKAAQAVLDARDAFPGSTLADLYDPVTMPPALAKAHAALDRAVERCYRKEPFPHDRARVEHLFALYEQLTAPLASAATKKTPRKRRT